MSQLQTCELVSLDELRSEQDRREGAFMVPLSTDDDDAGGADEEDPFMKAQNTESFQLGGDDICNFLSTFAPFNGDGVGDGEIEVQDIGAATIEKGDYLMCCGFPTFPERSGKNSTARNKDERQMNVVV